MEGLAGYLVYALGWLSFGFLHSLLAGDAVKARLKARLGAGYRLAYNLFATLHIAAVWLAGFALLSRETFAALEGWTGLFPALQGAGLVLGLFGLRGYDLGRFAGTAQLRWAKAGREEPEDEPLRTQGLNRYLRHPLYTAAFLLLWGAALSEHGLATALWGSVYLFVGSVYEERRLHTRYGKAYGDYKARTGRFIPRL
ncbi:MAG: methyltransferase family protein [Rhodospirillales bacterium]